MNGEGEDWRKAGERGTTEGNTGFRDGWMEAGSASGLIVQSVGDLREEDDDERGKGERNKTTESITSKGGKEEKQRLRKDRGRDEKER